MEKIVTLILVFTLVLVIFAYIFPSYDADGNLSFAHQYQRLFGNLQSVSDFAEDIFATFRDFGDWIKELVGKEEARLSTHFTL